MAANTALTILGLMGDSPSHGYGLKRRHDRHFRRARPLHVAQVYSTLGRLERDGLVAHAGTEQESGPDRKLYAVTGRGIASRDEWLSTPEAPSPHLQSTLYTKVVVALLTERDPRVFLDAQRALHLSRMRELTAFKRTGDLSDKLLADHELFHLEADLRWIDLAAERVDALSREVAE